MKIKGKGRFFGEITATPSKSVYIRKAICDYLSGGADFEKCADNRLIGEDFAVINSALKNISQADKLERTIVYCGESATCLRLLACVFSALGGRYLFTGERGLLSRPMVGLVNALNGHGVTAKILDGGIAVEGKLMPGKYAVDVSLSSQVCSGLIIGLALLDGDSEIILSSQLKSKPYVDLTVSVLSEYGVVIDTTPHGYYVRGDQKFQKADLPVDGDWSNGANFLVGAALSGGVRIKGLSADTVQGDRAILDILADVGAKVTVDGGEECSVLVEKGKRAPFSVSIDDTPDLGPILSVLAAFIPGESRIRGILRLVYKESDRMLEITRMLSAFGVKWTIDGDELIISGGEVKGCDRLELSDHRMVEAACIMAALSDGGATVTGVQSVNKAYADFFDDFIRLGGQVDE